MTTAAKGPSADNTRHCGKESDWTFKHGNENQI